MDSKTTLRQQMQTFHGILESAIGDCNNTLMANQFPGGKINSIAAIYAHTVLSEDGLLNGLVRGGTPVYYRDGWAAKIGLEMPQGTMEPNWDVTYDPALFRQYAAAVYAETDTYLAGVSDGELAKTVDPSFAPAMPVEAFVANVLAWHVATHQGEISALKGAQGVDGLVFGH
jgi:hypothetical protein